MLIDELWIRSANKLEPDELIRNETPNAGCDVVSKNVIMTDKRNYGPKLEFELRMTLCTLTPCRALTITLKAPDG